MLFRTNDTATSLGLLILRAGTGLLLIYGHGWGKLANYAERSAAFADPLGVGSAASFGLVVFAEVFCSALVVIGFLTRLAVIPIAIFTLVAVFIQHAADPFKQKELALLYLVPSLTLFFTGAGRFSIDHWIAARRRR